MTTYTELVTQIRDYTETDSNVLTSVIVNDFIEHTENRILRDLDIPIFTSHQYSNFTASSGFLTLPGGSSLTPTEFSVINSVQIYTAVGAARTYLERKDVSYMNEYWPNRATEGTPKYYSQWDDAAYFSEVSLSKLPDRLTSSNATTWIGDNAPALILYGCLAEAFKFLKGPAEMLQLYQQSYETALQEVAAQQMGRGKRDQYMAGVIRMPRPSIQPGLGSQKIPTQGGR
jgi:hypothetical protein